MGIVKMVCAVIFVLFSFSYLYFYQADVLAAVQHVLSDGVTHYNRTVGAVLITVALLLLQWAVSSFMRWGLWSYALTYFPSLLVLAVMTSPHLDTGGELSWGCWGWLFPLLLVVWLLVASFLIKLQSMPVQGGLFPVAFWINVATLCATCLFVGLVGNGNDVFHYRMRVESLLMEGRYDEAIETGQKSLATDANLTMLRIYALAKKGELGEKLFTFPLKGESTDMVPMIKAGGVTCVIYPVDSLYKFLGARPLSTQDTKTYLDVLTRTHKATRAVADYRLCGYLIDRNLDGFVRLLPRYYKINDHLPRHYREALTLYTHLRSNPLIVYHNEVMDTDFNDLQDLERQYKEPNARRLAVFDQYGGTYWWYYDCR